MPGRKFVSLFFSLLLLYCSVNAADSANNTTTPTTSNNNTAPTSLPFLRPFPLPSHRLPPPPPPPPTVIKATAVINNPPIKGLVTFSQVGRGEIRVRVELEGLKSGEHGFHVHDYGDLSDGCKSAGGHFNPTNKTHGPPSGTTERHDGDMGNILADEYGRVNTTLNGNFTPSLNNFIGRAIVIHELSDDLGRGNVTASKTTGNAGNRLACAVVGRSNPAS